MIRLVVSFHITPDQTSRIRPEIDASGGSPSTLQAAQGKGVTSLDVTPYLQSVPPRGLEPRSLG